MVRAKTFKKKSIKKQNSILKNTKNGLGKFFQKLAGKSLAIGISIGFILMSLLMLFANNLKVGQTTNEGNEIHAAADLVIETMPGIGK